LIPATNGNAVRTDHPFATVSATADERAAGALAPERLDTIVSSLRDHGAAVVEGVVDPAVCDRLHAAMLVDLDAAAAKPAALDVPGHVQHTPPPRAADLHVEVFANPVAVSIARALLGPRIQLSLYTGNTMLGGTVQAQPVHWDEPQLWPHLAEGGPAASLTVNIPLVDVTEDNGALELWPGTHRDARTGARVGDGLLVPEEWLEPRRAEVPPARVPVSKGALLLRDGRVWHRGTTNTTDQPRPMVAMVYATGWMRPLAIDFYPDAEPVLRSSGLSLTPRYRERFDHLEWPPSWDLVPKPVD
jgi:hypothetical protein